MRTRNKLLHCALALAIGTALSGPFTANAMDASDAPDLITIDSLTNLYGPVEFDHAMHADLADCALCHHHTTGIPAQDPNCLRCHATSGEADTVACADCHTADRFNKDYLESLDDPMLYHVDKPGLKGAYHINCIGCHVEVGAPSGCQDCHVMNDSGQQMFKTGDYAPDPQDHNNGGH
ncbi:MAG: cytochrome c3 family protein [Desulfobulbaceae bacterium]|uniref:Cytochrome c3 family protein n=1 Tax=Candidatus Desulfatifera sulfidica TaxID=2841691 RepID=A0A8J6NBW3_9BACT|nr:cytochrome c3 family protein [Candidatus Desulfatifera sulfidica]